MINFNRKLKVQLTMSRGNQAQFFLFRTLQASAQCKEIKRVEGFILVTQIIRQDLGKKSWFGLGLFICF